MVFRGRAALRGHSCQCRQTVLAVKNIRAAELKLRAERKLGELLAETEKNKGTQGRIQEHIAGGDIVQPPDDTPTLTDLGVEKHQSSRWQTVASLPEEDFEAHVAETKEKGEELTTARVYRLAR